MSQPVAPALPRRRQRCWMDSIQPAHATSTRLGERACAVYYPASLHTRRSLHGCPRLHLHMRCAHCRRLVLWELLTWAVPWGATSPFQVRQRLVGQTDGQRACCTASLHFHAGRMLMGRCWNRQKNDVPCLLNDTRRSAAGCWTAGGPRCHQQQSCRGRAPRPSPVWSPIAS